MVFCFLFSDDTQHKQILKKNLHSLKFRRIRFWWLTVEERTHPHTKHCSITYGHYRNPSGLLLVGKTTIPNDLGLVVVAELSWTFQGGGVAAAAAAARIWHAESTNARPTSTSCILGGQNLNLSDFALGEHL